VNAAPAGTSTVSVCPNQLPYNWNGQLYTQGGTYTQTFTRAASCDSIATLTLTVDQSMTNERYPTITTSPNTATQLQARQLGTNFDYLWDPSAGLNSISIYNPIFSSNQETEYTISITSDLGCKVVDTLLVKVNGSGQTGIASDLFVPNAWTPNGDGVNDTLFPLTENVTKLNFFRVFNRWGQLMFETNVIGNGWDGVFNGRPMMMDTYTWTASAVGIDGKTFMRSGNAVLIR
jgi:gliding motility-associated-like protein